MKSSQNFITMLRSEWLAAIYFPPRQCSSLLVKRHAGFLQGERTHSGPFCAISKQLQRSGRVGYQSDVQLQCMLACDFSPATKHLSFCLEHCSTKAPVAQVSQLPVARCYLLNQKARSTFLNNLVSLADGSDMWTTTAPRCSS